MSKHYWLPVALLAGLLGAAAARAEGTLRFGAVSFLRDDTRASLEPITRYLDAELVEKVRLLMYPGYNDVLAALAADDLDLALLTPIVYLNAQESLQVRPLAYGVYPSGAFSYRSVLLARKADAAVSKLADLKGKKVGFIDLFSASGYVVPKLMLEEGGVAAKSVEDVFFGNHLDALAALDAGEVVAAATYDLVFAQAGTKNRSLADYRILATSDPIPSDVIVAGRKLDAELAARVQDRLFSYYYLRKDDSRFAGGFYTGFVPPDDSVFVSLRAMYKKILGSKP